MKLRKGANDMKKFLAILAAMMLISTVAFGDELSDSTPVSGGS